MIKVGEELYWRFKGDKCYIRDIIKRVNGFLITFDSEYTYKPRWLDINEIDTYRVNEEESCQK